MVVGTRIFLAGAEVETLTRSLLDNGVRSILYSYYYIQQMRREGFIARMQEEYPDCQWFLDSGAFTYMVQNYNNPGKLPPTSAYVKRYFMYIDEYGERFCRITEPDMDIAGVPEEKVTEWREEMLERWPHLNVTPVWHPSRGREEWVKYCEDPRIKTLAMGSDVKKVGMGQTRHQVLRAARAGKPVHGFGMTRIQTVLKFVPYDSVDSTSWVMGQKGGVTYIFRANKFITLPSDKKHYRFKYKKYFKNIGCDPQLVVDDNVAETRKANVIAWKNLGDRLELLKHLSGQTKGVNHVTATPQVLEQVKAIRPFTGDGTDSPRVQSARVTGPFRQGNRETSTEPTPRYDEVQLGLTERDPNEPFWRPKERTKETIRERFGGDPSNQTTVARSEEEG